MIILICLYRQLVVLLFLFQRRVAANAFVILLRRGTLPRNAPPLTAVAAHDDGNNDNQPTSKMPTITRLYTGDDGQSHFEQVTLSMQAFTDLEGAYGYATAAQPCPRGLIFRMSPPGYALEWHTAPRRQYIVQLAGCVQITVGSGETRVMSPGDVLLAEDLTGQGHCTTVVGNETRFYAVLSLES